MSCNIPAQQVEWMRILQTVRNTSNCIPVVECHILDPYSPSSILSVIERAESFNETELQHDLYFTLRIIAEIFPVIIHMLLNIAIIVATRETSVGRGNVGIQWAFYPIGVLIFASVIGLINHAMPNDCDKYFAPILAFSISMFVCAFVVLLSGYEKLNLTIKNLRQFSFHLGNFR